MSTDYRVLCAELIEAVLADDSRLDILDIAGRARAAMAEQVVEGVTDEELERRFRVWWYDEGSGMPPGADEDQEAHVHRVSQIAWHNGAYVARHSGHQPAPPAAGEAERAVADLRECADLLSWLPADGAEPMRRAADLLERHPAPVPVAERLQQLEDLAADAVSGLRYIEQTHGRLYGVGWDRVYEKADRLQPGHALPLPAGEVQP